MKCSMMPCVLDLRKEGCPMALLLAKRASQKIGSGQLDVYVSDKSSMLDILRYLDKNNFSVNVDDSREFYLLTIIKKSTCSDV